MKAIIYSMIIYVFFTSLPTLTSQEMTKNSITNLAPKEFKKKIETTKNAVLIDVRSRFEFRVGGHLDGAINTGMGRRVAKFAKANHTSTPIFVSCLSGHRSLNVCEQLRDLGFMELYNLEGGLMAWKKADLSLSLKLKRE